MKDLPFSELIWVEEKRLLIVVALEMVVVEELTTTGVLTTLEPLATAIWTAPLAFLEARVRTV